MRIKAVFSAVVLIFTTAAVLTASPGVSWSAAVDTIVSIGDTRYLMEEPGSPGVSSELIFPLNTLLAAATLNGESSGGRRGWAFAASVAVNLLAPFGKMEDWDWWMYYGTPKVPFSYTESDAEMLWIAASASWQPVLASGAWGRVSAVLGYRFQFVSQNVIGYNGWYNDSDLDGIADGYYPQTRNGLVLTYWVMYNTPSAGLAVRLTPVAGMYAHAEAGLAIPYVADEDDHVLRYKLSKASGLGFGGYARLLVHYTLGNSDARWRPYLEVGGSAFAAKANTQQTQTFYTGSINPPPGTSLSGIDHQISTRQFGGSLTVGIEF